MRTPTLLPMLLVLCVVAGCSTTMRHTPKDFELDETWPTVTSATSVGLRTGNAPLGEHSIALGPQTLILDLREYTQALVNRVERALTAQGVRVDPDAPKSLELEVVYANILPGAAQSHCVIDFTVRAGDGYVHGHQARANSIDPEKACNAALSEAALECLSDPRVLEYLSRS